MDRCEYCGRTLLLHSIEYLMYDRYASMYGWDPGSRPRPDESDTERVSYGHVVLWGLSSRRCYCRSCWVTRIRVLKGLGTGSAEEQVKFRSSRV